VGEATAAMYAVLNSRRIAPLATSVRDDQRDMFENGSLM
jgi:hypothetical protein